MLSEKNQKVVIIEDSNTDARLLGEIVRQFGYESETVNITYPHDITTAIAKIQNGSDRQILCDGIEGFWIEIYEAIKDIPSLHFALVSAGSSHLQGAQEHQVQTFNKRLLFGTNPDSSISQLHDWLNIPIPPDGTD